MNILSVKVRNMLTLLFFVRYLFAEVESDLNGIRESTRNAFFNKIKEQQEQIQGAVNDEAAKLLGQSPTTSESPPNPED